MHIDRFRHDDTDHFLALADAEGWICDRWELEFLLEAFPQGCLVARRDGQAAAFVTAIKYGRSGWIGNLIVRSDMRGEGLGSALLERAIAALMDGGANAVWLTASAAGMGIYRRRGFVMVDTVKRWTGTGRSGEAEAPADISLAAMMALDEAGWGDCRELLVGALAARNTVLGCGDSFLIIQRCGSDFQIGPWGGGGDGVSHLIDAALARAGAGTRVFLDVPVRNCSAAALLYGRGFRVKGSTSLMYLGEPPAYKPDWIFALASMGSMG